MTGFDQAWLAVANVRNGEPVSPRLRPFLEAVYHQSLAHPPDSSKLKKNQKDLLLFLSGEGRSNANCWAADLFFARNEAWECDWAEQKLNSVLPRRPSPRIFGSSRSTRNSLRTLPLASRF